jgi:hypothetical protein
MVDLLVPDVKLGGALNQNTDIDLSNKQLTFSGNGQLAVGTSTPDASAKVDITSYQSGFLMPRLTRVQRDAILSPAAGLMIYNIDCNAFNYFNGTVWIQLPNTLSTPGIISGISNPCQNATNVTYSIAPVINASSYLWTVPSGAVITSGQGTPSISATIGATGGNVCVSARNSCDTSNVSCITLTLEAPPAPPVAGSATNMLVSSFTANWSIITGATHYYLDVATDTGFTALVSGYSNLNVGNIVSTAVTGVNCNTTYYYRVRSGSACGTSIHSNRIAVTTQTILPAQPGSITGTTFACSGNGAYSIAPVTGAASYQWTVPSGYTILSGQGTTSISVQLGATSGSISVSAVDACGYSIPSTLAVTICQLAAWPNYMPLTIANPSGAALADYQLQIPVSFIAGKMNADFSDLRFTDGSCTTLNYWIESYSASTSAVVWVRIPSIPASGTTVYMYYGNSSATSLSNAPATFLLFDDFNRPNSGSIGGAWTASNSSGSGWDISGNAARLTTGSNEGAITQPGFNALGKEVRFWGMTSGNGFGGLNYRYTHYIGIYETNSVSSQNGYGVNISRSDQNFNNSNVERVEGGTATGAAVMASTQFVEGLNGKVQFNTDGSINCYIAVNSGNMDTGELFSFPAHTVNSSTQSNGSNFKLLLGSADVRAPQVDQVLIRNFIVPEPIVSFGAESNCP